LLPVTGFILSPHPFKTSSFKTTPPYATRKALRATLPRLLADVRPDLVLYNAGVDVAAGDSLGKLALSDAGIAARDDFVMGTCAAAGVPVRCF
jgi:acetoin utilization deacetylase AcuC-like enzyme